MSKAKQVQEYVEHGRNEGETLYFALQYPSTRFASEKAGGGTGVSDLGRFVVGYAVRWGMGSLAVKSTGRTGYKDE